MTIQPYQVKVYMQARKTGSTQVQASAIAGISERSGQRIESGQYQPERGGKRDWRTRPDPLARVWEAELEPMLRKEPRLKPTTLYEYLQEQYPGEYPQVLAHPSTPGKGMEGDARRVTGGDVRTAA